MQPFFQKIKKLFDTLSSKPSIAGLQITDSGAFYTILKNDELKTFSLRFPPGIMREGKVLDAEQFVTILRELHEQIIPGKQVEMVKTIVSLPAGVVSTQSFSVPNIDEERLKESIDLNLQMISPLGPNNVYMSSQIIEETPDRYDVLGAFAEKEVVDNLRNLLESARFYPILFEFPALSLSHVLGSALSDSEKPVVTLHISSDGIDLSIFKNLSLVFSYFRSWKSIQGDAREISKAAFDTMILDEVRKVTNFSLTKFKSSPAKIFLVTSGFETEIQTLLSGQTSLQVVPFRIDTYPLGPAWYVALGASIRGTLASQGMQFIELGNQNTFDLFYEEQITNFISLWRNIFLAVLGIFLVAFITTSFFLSKNAALAQERLSDLKLRAQNDEVLRLEQSAQEFNELVESAQSVRGGETPWITILQHISAIASQSSITLDHIQFPSITAPIIINAHASTNDALVKFRNTLIGDPGFVNVNLPFSKVNQEGDSSFAFEITFQIAPPK